MIGERAREFARNARRSDGVVGGDAGGAFGGTPAEYKAIFTYTNKVSGFKLHAGQTLVAYGPPVQRVVRGAVKETGEEGAVPLAYLAHLAPTAKRATSEAAQVGASE